MTKKKTVLSEELVNEIQTYLLNHPNEPMKKAQKHFQISRQVFSRVVKQELGMWNPQSKNQNTWPPGTHELIAEVFETSPSGLKIAYEMFLTQYKGDRPLSINAFRFLANKQNLLGKIKRPPVRFSSNNYELILKDLSQEPFENLPDAKRQFDVHFLHLLLMLKQTLSF